VFIEKCGLWRSNNSNDFNYLIFDEINVIKILLFSNEVNKKNNTHVYNIVKNINVQQQNIVIVFVLTSHTYNTIVVNWFN